ncbi:MAG: FHA domain-containing protein [Actinomycetota bacterium]
MQCSRCGHDNAGEARFCSSCGTLLLPSDAPPQANPAVVSPPAGPGAGGATAVLHIARGPNAGSNFAVGDDRLQAGRHTDSDVFLDDITVSRRHATFQRTPDGVVVEDVGSLNGTYVNRDRIDRRVLADGDEIQIGRYVLVFRAA